ncbi:hypothetical protein [Klebsiella variicola]
MKTITNLSDTNCLEIHGASLIRDTKVLITLNLPDGQKTTIEGEWRHMSDANRLSERITMLQHAIYEQYEEYRADIPVSWSR